MFEDNRIGNLIFTWALAIGIYFVGKLIIADLFGPSSCELLSGIWGFAALFGLVVMGFITVITVADIDL